MTSPCRNKEPSCRRQRAPHVGNHSHELNMSSLLREPASLADPHRSGDTSTHGRGSRNASHRVELHRSRPVSPGAACRLSLTLSRDLLEPFLEFLVPSLTSCSGSKVSRDRRRHDVVPTIRPGAQVEAHALVRGSPLARAAQGDDQGKLSSLARAFKARVISVVLDAVSPRLTAGEQLQVIGTARRGPLALRRRARETVGRSRCRPSRRYRRMVAFMGGLGDLRNSKMPRRSSS